MLSVPATQSQALLGDDEAREARLAALTDEVNDLVKRLGDAASAIWFWRDLGHLSSGRSSRDRMYVWVKRY